ncbi:hypothetical protein [Spirosoma rhododendri]|uniref:Uncharacterized protein n=1 Tax=Spirosoma rhododendri TaxID=2728024 RepID=A0A7L5DRF4_9BACT|nr:hypothetical protein [Spirosoma rhododendri]QJD80182.1 hypothetical protein HH216_18500 [Spirosoma rhododendri]
MNNFTESQRFRQWWLWAIMLGVTALMLIVPAGGALRWISWLTILLVSLLLLAWRLDTRYDDSGVHYRVWPFMRWRTIRWADVSTAAVTQYDFVGYGIRWNFGEWVYNVAGNQGLRIKTTDNKRILLGTQRPDELRAFLSTLTIPGLSH